MSGGIKHYNPISIIRLAARRVPVVWFALALTAIAAAMGLAKTYLGDIEYPELIAVLIASMLAMLFLFIISQAATLGGRAAPIALVLMWSMCLVVVCFMGFTVTAVAVGLPETWARVLHLPTKADIDTMSAVKGPDGGPGPAPKPAQQVNHSKPPKPVPPNATPSRPSAQIGIAITCIDCPADLTVPNLVGEIGISSAPIGETPSIEPLFYARLDSVVQGVRWATIDLSDRQEIRVIIPDADGKDHKNEGIAHNNKVEQIQFTLAPGQKAKVTLTVQREGFFLLHHRVDIRDKSVSTIP